MATKTLVLALGMAAVLFTGGGAVVAGWFGPQSSGAVEQRADAQPDTLPDVERALDVNMSLDQALAIGGW